MQLKSREICDTASACSVTACLERQHERGVKQRKVHVADGRRLAVSRRRVHAR